MSYVATRLAAAEPSASSAASMANALRATGVEAIGPRPGEPDFLTPRHIAATAHSAVVADETLYTPAADTLTRRKAE